VDRFIVLPTIPPSWGTTLVAPQPSIESSHADEPHLWLKIPEHFIDTVFLNVGFKDSFFANLI
jgi:hypothetical protein